jgi:hypothetical protein
MKVICGTCGREHPAGETQVGFVEPEAYLGIPEQERLERASLTADWCIIDGRRRFLRGVLEIPVLDGGIPFGWGVWVEVDPGSSRAWERECSRERQGEVAAFPAVLDSNLWGYPQHHLQPGPIHLVVQPSSDPSQRPTLMATDPDHPLTQEQQHGITRQRALDLLAPVLHQDPTADPWFATIERSGWTLDDAAGAFAEHKLGVYWVPPEEDRQSIRPGDLVKLLFSIATAAADGGTKLHRERMWVNVDGQQGSLYTGRLANHPFEPGRMARGLRVWFGAEHILDIIDADGKTASENHGLIRCAAHGMSKPAFVCRHLATGEGRGFHVAHAPDRDDPRPDAWCDSCDRIFLQEGGEWTDLAAKAAQATVLCAACYDAAEAASTTR